LTAPWPKLVISAGRRNELVALWIKRRSPSTRVVHIGRPWCNPQRFDLIIATTQYQLEGFSNVLVNDLPLHKIDPPTLAAARIRWQSTFGLLAQPRTLLLLGGNSGGYVLDGTQATRMAKALERFSDGSLVISSSRRTPKAFLDTLLAHIRTPDLIYRWGEEGDNPYLGLLAWADRIVVTEDSASMTAEAIAAGAQVFIADIDSAAPEDGTAWWQHLSNFAWKPLSHRLAMKFAPQRFHRSVRRFHHNLAAADRVQWLAENTRNPTVPAGSGRAADGRRSHGLSGEAAPGHGDLERSVIAVQQLLR
jgi:mitochondrial fission protein ELM1